MSRWLDISRDVIDKVDAKLSPDTEIAVRRKAVDAAYPFGERKYHPYKQWLKARREYLVPFGHQPKNAPLESPMERAMRRGKARLNANTDTKEECE